MVETDTELLRRCLGGENSAFAGIVESYQDRIYSFALRLLKDPQAAEDAAQDAFVKAFRGLASYNFAYPFSSWLFRIAHNVCMDALRAGGRTVSLDGEDFPDLPDCAVNVEESAAAALDGERIEALLGSLPPLYSEALLLQYREDMGPAEIARVTGVPEGTVKARLFRGREMIKAKLGKAAPGEPFRGPGRLARPPLTSASIGCKPKSACGCPRKGSPGAAPDATVRGPGA